MGVGKIVLNMLKFIFRLIFTRNNHLTRRANFFANRKKRVLNRKVSFIGRSNHFPM